MGIDARMIAKNVPAFDDAWLTEMSWRICESLDAGTFMISDGTDIFKEVRRALSVTDDGEIEVNLWGRYYGIGYERGDLLKLCAVAEWLEANIPGCEVWYGGDSDDVLVPWPESERAKLRQHLYTTSGRDYYRSWGDREQFGLPPACALCPGGVYRGDRYGCGPKFAAFRCNGCGKNAETNDGGETWTPRPKG